MINVIYLTFGSPVLSVFSIASFKITLFGTFSESTVCVIQSHEQEVMTIIRLSKQANILNSKTRHPVVSLPRFKVRPEDGSEPPTIILVITAITKPERHSLLKAPPNTKHWQKKLWDG